MTSKSFSQTVIKTNIDTIVPISVPVTSQTVIKTNIDTIVPISVPVAKLIIKDLIKGDGAQVEIGQLNKLIQLKDEQISLLKEKDGVKEQKISNLESIIDKKDERIDLETQNSQNLTKELKRQKRKTFLFKVYTYAGVIAASILLLSK
jgi:hypothetical protein